MSNNSETLEPGFSLQLVITVSLHALNMYSESLVMLRTTVVIYIWLIHVDDAHAEILNFIVG